MPNLEFKRHWGLAEDVIQLNHGSFGACPRKVLAAQQDLRDELERDPTRFFNRRAPRLIEEAREALGGFVGAPASDLAFVPNVTTALNAVMASLCIGPGDAVLISDLEYNATRNVVHHYARARGARVDTVHLPFPSSGQDEIQATFLEAITPETRAAVVDHVTSQTGLVFPIESITRALHARGIVVVVDGAHAPGMLPLDIASLAPDYYAGNCHKWICAPKGAGFLYVRPELQTQIRPAIISHGANSGLKGNARFRREFEWTGTIDPTAQIAVKDALAFMDGIVPGGFAEVMTRNRSLCLRARQRVLDAVGAGPPCPDEMIGSLATLPLPDSPRYPPPQATSALDPDPLLEDLMDRFRIQVPILTLPGRPGRLLRISAQLYNDDDDYEALAEALRSVL